MSDDKSVSQRLAELLGSDDWVVVLQGHKALLTADDLDELEATL